MPFILLLKILITKLWYKYLFKYKIITVLFLKELPTNSRIVPCKLEVKINKLYNIKLFFIDYFRSIYVKTFKHRFYILRLVKVPVECQGKQDVRVSPFKGFLAALIKDVFRLKTYFSCLIDFLPFISVKTLLMRLFIRFSNAIYSSIKDLYYQTMI
jgi:hypothetical protein